MMHSCQHAAQTSSTRGRPRRATDLPTVTRVPKRATGPSYRTSSSASRSERPDPARNRWLPSPWQRAAVPGSWSLQRRRRRAEKPPSTSRRPDLSGGGIGTSPAHRALPGGRGGGSRQWLHERRRLARASSEQIDAPSRLPAGTTSTRNTAGFACGVAHGRRGTMVVRFAPDPIRSSSTASRIGGTADGVDGGAADVYAARLGVAGRFRDGRSGGGCTATGDEFDVAARRGMVAASLRRAASATPTSRGATPTGRLSGPAF